MNVGSLFSGIGGLDHGLARAGWQHAFFCESDEWRRSVLAQHWPGVPIYDDVREVQARPVDGGFADAAGEHRTERHDGVGDGLDLLCGGFPCQDLSVAGQRRGLAGERSGLFHEFARIIDALRPGWVLIENVPGLLSSNGGRDFGIVLGTLADLGYGVAWRVLDSRFFGVPQRRRRVYIVGAIAHDDPRAAADRAGEVLAVGSRCPRHPATRTEAGPNVAVASLSGLGTGGPDDNDGQGGRLVANTVVAKWGNGTGHAPDEMPYLVAAPLSHGSNPNSNMAGRRREDDVNLVTAFHQTQEPIHGDDFSPALGRTSSIGMGVAFSENQRAEVLETPIARQLTSGGGKPGQGYPAVRTGASVRRLTPTECERLQALPDGWTAYGPDSRRYAALGDAVTSSVGEWIGRRLRAVAA